MKTEILTSELRTSLKNTIQKEIEQLPKQLKSLEPKERLNILCKLMPYVFPKVETVHNTEGEPDNWNL